MRSQKSCNKLKTSFLELLSQSDGLPIRMTELLQLAGVSKTTFYVYYENLDQLAFDLIDEQLRELNAVLRLRRKNGEGESDYVVLTQWIEQHWELLLLLNRSKYRSYLEQSLFQFLSEELLIVQKDSPYLRCGAVLSYGYDKIIYRHKIMRCCSLTDNVASIRNRDAARIAAFIGKHFCFSVFRKNDRGRICKVIASIVFYSQAADQIGRESGTF